MNYIDDILFPDNSFPIIIKKKRAEVSDDLSAANRAMHEAIEIKYFYEGKSTLLINGKTVNTEAGDIIIINPYEFHTTVDYKREKNGKYCLIMIGLDFFNGMPAADLNLRQLLLNEQNLFKNQIKDDSRMQKILSEITEEYTELRPAYKLAITGLLAEFFSLLIRKGLENKISVSNSDSTRYYQTIEPAIRMIRDRYPEKFTIDMLANACRISKYHFCRIFKSVTGVSAIQYINAYRLKIADAMLSNTDRQISEIASICGFDDTGYFSKIYKKQFGKTPLCKRVNKRI